MDPANAVDVRDFKHIIDREQHLESDRSLGKRQNWVATVTLQVKSGKEPWLNPERVKDLEFILTKILNEISDDGVILFPAGYFNTGSEKIGGPFYQEISKSIQRTLSNSSANIVVVAGIDGFQDTEKNDRDQVAIAVDKKDILGIARKHFPTEDDIEFDLVESNFSDTECGKTRFFELNDTRYYIAVCNDINAGHRGGIETDQTFDIILNPIHKFEKGDSVTDFVRKGMGVESRQWNCPVFGSVKFINGSPVPDIWKAGVYWGFIPGINILTPGTDIEKFAIPGKKLFLMDLPEGDRAVVEVIPILSRS